MQLSVPAAQPGGVQGVFAGRGGGETDEELRRHHSAVLAKPFPRARGQPGDDRDDYPGDAFFIMVILTVVSIYTTIASLYQMYQVYLLAHAAAKAGVEALNEVSIAEEAWSAWGVPPVKGDGSISAARGDIFARGGCTHGQVYGRGRACPTARGLRT